MSLNWDDINLRLGPILAVLINFLLRDVVALKYKAKQK